MGSLVHHNGMEKSLSILYIKFSYVFKTIYKPSLVYIDKEIDILEIQASIVECLLDLSLFRPTGTDSGLEKDVFV